MKLLMVSGDRSILAGKKGAFWYTLEEFAKYWERVDVIVPRVTMENGKWKMENPFSNVFFHPSPHGLWYQPRWIFKKGKELIAAHHHEVMTVHEYPPFYNGLGARRLQRATKIPAMVEIHHVVGYPTAASCSEWIGYRLSRWWLSRGGTAYAAKVRVVNPDTERLLRQWGIAEEKLALLFSLYLDTHALTPDPAVPKQYDVVFCARLVPNKGLMDVIEAVAKLPGASLLIIGDGPERGRAERLVSSLAIKNRVTFAGWLPAKEDVYRAMQSAKIFVMNSQSEGGPRVLFEAMALGLPIVSTEVGLAPLALAGGERGLPTTGFPEDLSEKLSLLLRDDALSDRLAHAALEVRQLFDRETCVRDYAQALQLIASSSTR